MDTSENMDSLDESAALPELSFDDLLDPSPSPIKKSSKSYFDDDALEIDNDRKSHTDDTLNTPGHKRPPTAMQKNYNTSVSVSSGSRMSIPIRTQAVKLGNSSSTFTNAVKSNNSTMPAPVVLNSKNILPKSAPQILNNSIKFTQKVAGGSGNTTNLSLSGKTAMRTSNGQIIYIQKTPPTSNVKASNAGTVVKSQTSASNNSKPVTIQVLRAADGSYLPLKSTTSGTNGKTTLTLSPSSLAGKKIVSSAGGQVIIKGTIKPADAAVTASTAKTITTNAISGVRTVVKPIAPAALTTTQVNDLNKSKNIVVHGTSGKQIIVSNQNIVKLSPKTQTVATTTTGTSVTTSTTGSGQIHAIQIPGKIGVQYVRVLPNPKMPTKTINTSATTSVTSTSTSSTAKTVNSASQPVKLLNALPQKFTVVQKGTTTKIVVTQKKDTPSNSGNNTEFSPMTSKVQKTLVTVPTIRSLNDDKNKNNTQLQTQQQNSLIKPTQQSLLSNSSNKNQFIRKHKISEINSEIQRITTSSDNTGPPEIKKNISNSRIVVVPNNLQPKILNNSIQQPGRVPSSITLPSQGSNASRNVVGSVIRNLNVTQHGKKLYTVLKAPPVEQKTNSEMYSVLKTTNQSSSAPASESSSAVVKPLINKQQLIQQQQKLLQLKQQNQQQNMTNSSSSYPTLSSTYVLPIKIKEEPVDSIPQATNNSNAETAGGAQQNVATTVADEDGDNLDTLVGGVRRKHCNCSKSQCLKLYCDCFANGEFCQDCTCKDCLNNLENEDERQKAIKACLERNPNAFKPKITSSREQADMRLHNKGCNCKRSGCLKNYCECYEAKIPCSSNCKCVGCRNVEDRPDLDMDPVHPKIMAAIAMSGNTNNNSLKRTYDKSQRDFGGPQSGLAIKSERLSKESTKPLCSSETLGDATSPTLERQQCNFITQEVIDATIQCMITQADECEKNSLAAHQMEKMVMEELGRCLVEIIDFSIRNTDNSYSQE